MNELMPNQFGSKNKVVEGFFSKFIKYSGNTDEKHLHPIMGLLPEFLPPHQMHENQTWNHAFHFQRTTEELARSLTELI